MVCNTQGFARDRNGRKVAFVTQAMALKLIRTAVILEANQSAQLQPTDETQFDRDTVRPDLQEHRGQQVAEEVGQNEAFEVMGLTVIPAYPPGRFQNHPAANQKYYAVLRPQGDDGGTQLETSFLAGNSLRAPMRVECDIDNFYALHGPSGNHAGARGIAKKIADELAARHGQEPWVLAGDFNFSPTEVDGSDCAKHADSPAICCKGPHTFKWGDYFVHCTGQPTRATGTLDFAISNDPHFSALAESDLDTIQGYSIDHLPIIIEFHGHGTAAPQGQGGPRCAAHKH